MGALAEGLRRVHKKCSPDIELTPFFTVHVGILPELEKMMCKIAFGAAMDVLNSNFKKMDLPLPLIDHLQSPLGSPAEKAGWLLAAGWLALAGWLLAGWLAD